MNCLLCDSDELSLLTEELRHGPGRVHYCSTCALGMLDPSSCELVDYEHTYRDRHGPILGKRSSAAELFDAYRPYQHNRIQALLRHLGSDARVLEVGCSAGYFLDAIRGAVKEVVGVECNMEAAERARLTGCEVYPQVGDVLGKFDLICLFQTVEHMTDPLTELTHITQRLAPDGLLCIEVPNLNDPLLALYHNAAYRKFFFHEAHLWYFSAISLRLLMRRLGLKGTMHFTQDYSFLNHLNWHFHNEPQATCHSGLGTPRLFLRDPPTPAELALMEWAKTANALYKGILAQFGYTENIMFIGKREKVKQAVDNGRPK